MSARDSSVEKPDGARRGTGIKLVDGVRAAFRDAVGAGAHGDGGDVAGGQLALQDGLRVPPAWKLSLFRGYLKARDSAHNAGVRVRNNTVGRVTGHKLPLRRTPLPLNLADLLMLLCKAHARQARTAPPARPWFGSRAEH